MSASAKSTSSDRVPFAVASIIVTVLALSLGDALVKMTSGSFVIWQIFVMRSLILLPVLVILAVSLGSLRMPQAFGWIALRSLMLIAMWICYYLALPKLSLSAAAASYYTLPIFITLFSALFVGDCISKTGWIAVALGFVGVLLILRPKAGDFNLFALLPLVSAMLYAGAMIVTRTRCRDEHPLSLSLALNLGFIVVGGLATGLILLVPTELRQGFVFAPWTPMGREEWVSMGLLAAAILIGSIGAAIAYQNGPPAVVGAFDFAYVGFAVIWGAVFFNETPDLIASIGMVMIVGAGVLSLRQ